MDPVDAPFLAPVPPATKAPPPDAIGSTPAASQFMSPASHGTGANSIDHATGLAEKLQRASFAAIDQHLGESKKSRVRGPDKRPRVRRATGQFSRVAVADVDHDPIFRDVAEGAPEPLTPVVVDVPAFDEETARAIIEIGLGLLNDGAAAIVRAVALKETNDKSLAEEAAKGARMSEKIEAAVKMGACQCAKKYAVRMEYAPEMMLGGGLVIWAGQISLSVKALKTMGKELREAK